MARMHHFCSCSACHHWDHCREENVESAWEETSYGQLCPGGCIRLGTHGWECVQSCNGCHSCCGCKCCVNACHGCCHRHGCAVLESSNSCADTDDGCTPCLRCGVLD